MTGSTGTLMTFAKLSLAVGVQKQQQQQAALQLRSSNATQA